jgi:hypothetical protein
LLIGKRFLSEKMSGQNIGHERFLAMPDFWWIFSRFLHGVFGGFLAPGNGN